MGSLPDQHHQNLIRESNRRIRTISRVAISYGYQLSLRGKRERGMLSYPEFFYGRISFDIPEVDTQIDARLHVRHVSILRCKELSTGGASLSLLFHFFSNG
jgi:hypothetical protein